MKESCPDCSEEGYSPEECPLTITSSYKTDWYGTVERARCTLCKGNFVRYGGDPRWSSDFRG
jgi:hypothetical protein